jgi:hypothetical protein
MSAGIFESIPTAGWRGPFPVRLFHRHTYRIIGAAYDSVSLFLLDLVRYLRKYPDMKTFVAVVRDWERGKHYRLYAWINSKNIPC